MCGVPIVERNSLKMRTGGTLKNTQLIDRNLCLQVGRLYSDNITLDETD